jgi:hypothetical protein
MAKAKSDIEIWEEYRRRLKQRHGIDIKKFKESLKGGLSAGHPIIDYNLDQLIMGVKVEQEHTKNKYLALEIAMDHLQEIPDYYTRLDEMEETYEQEKQK